MRNMIIKLIAVLLCAVFISPCIYCFADEDMTFKEGFEYNFVTGTGSNAEKTGYVKVLGYKKLGNNTYVYCKPIEKWASGAEEIFVAADKIVLIIAKETKPLPNKIESK